MLIKLNEQYTSQLIEFIRKHHDPEKGTFIDYNLLEGIFKKINRKDYENDKLICYLDFENNVVDAIAFLSINDSEYNLGYDIALTFYSVNYNATVNILNMPQLKNKKIYIAARSPYIYQHLLTYFGNVPENVSTNIYYHYKRHINKNIDGYSIKKVEETNTAEEISYMYGLFCDDIMVSQCIINLLSIETTPELSNTAKVWEMIALRTYNEYRRQGYASILTTYAANKILEFNGVPLCYIDIDNVASQCNAHKCGFIPLYIGVDFTVVL